MTGTVGDGRVESHMGEKGKRSVPFSSSVAKQHVLEEEAARDRSGARRAVLAGVGLAAALVAAGLGVYHGKIKPDTDRADLAQRAALRDQEERLRRIEEEKARLDRKIAAAERQLFEEKMKKATAMATAQPSGSASTRPISTGAVRPKKACRPCADPASPFCGLDGCEMER
jgi:uncharacterized protein HemX